MKVYKLTLEPRSAFRTPLQSDTLFGHLMWALCYREGEQALVAFLDQYRAGDPPLLVSAGFPEGTLPAPAFPRHESSDGNSPADATARSIVGQAVARTLYLSLDQWWAIAGALSPGAVRQILQKQGAWPRRRAVQHPVTRTAVDRITGSAREAQLFVAEETFYEPGYRIDVWLEIADEALLPRVQDWWRWVEANGFGRRKSAGGGAFRIVGGLAEAGGELPQVAEPNGFVSLSAWVPARGDPTDVLYRTCIKRGKLAEALALPHPWKKPLIMLEPGAIAYLPSGAILREWYGGLVENVHASVTGIVQYGLAFPMGVKIGTI